MKLKTVGAIVVCLLAFPALGPSQTTAATAKQRKITMAEARKIALARQPGTIKSAELEKEKGKLIYSFDIRRPDGIHEVNVDASSGQVVEDSVESPAAEAKEKAQEKNHKN
jgi:hypothetical protein